MIKIETQEQKNAMTLENDRVTLITVTRKRLDTVAEARQARIQLEKAVGELVSEFNTCTGLVVESLNVKGEVSHRGTLKVFWEAKVNL